MLFGQYANAGKSLIGYQMTGLQTCFSSNDPSCSAACRPSCGEDPVSCGNDGCGDPGYGESCSSLFTGGGCDLTSILSLKKSDHCFDDCISPITNPVFFEDPRTLTEARLIYLNHNVPGALGGGKVQLSAM
jgi:hypothetical protein